MEPLFRTTEEYYRDTELNEFEISEFEFTYLNVYDDLDISEFEEFEVKVIKFDFSGYEKSYYYYLKRYLNNFVDHSESQYIDDEINDFKKLYDLLVSSHNLQIELNDLLSKVARETTSYSIRYFLIAGNKYHSLLNQNQYQKTLASIKKIINFLEFKLSELNGFMDEITDKDDDLVGPSVLNFSEKIIMLHRLGVLDFLKDHESFKNNNNRLANVVRIFLGGKLKNIQPMINAIYSHNNVIKNNPLNSVKKVEKIDQMLISLGFNLKNKN